MNGKAANKIKILEMKITILDNLIKYLINVIAEHKISLPEEILKIIENLYNLKRKPDAS